MKIPDFLTKTMCHNQQKGIINPNRRYLWLFLALQLIFIFAITIRSKSEPFENKKIGSFQIIGSIIFTEKKLKKALNVDKGFFGRDFTRLELEKTINELNSFYISRGYIDFFAAKEFSLSEDGQKVNIRIIVFEGIQYIIKEIIISGLPREIIPDSGELLAIKQGLSLKENKPYDPRRVKSDELKIAKKILNQGHRSVKIVSEIKKNTNKVSINFRINPGPKWHIENLSFSGNKSVQNFVIINELAISKGDNYSPSNIEKSIDDLYKTGLFRSISIKEIENRESPGDKPAVTIHFDLEESNHKSIGFGAGYDNVEEWKGIIRWQNRNAFSRGALLRSDLSYSKTKKEAKITYKERNFLMKKLIIENRPIWRKRIYEEISQINYELKTLGVENNLIYPLASFLQFSFGYDYIYNYDIRLNQEEIPFSSAQKIEQYKNSNEQILNQSLSFSSRDNFLNPTKGIYVKLSTKAQWKINYPLFNFYQVNLVFSFYLPLIFDFVLAPSAGMGIKTPMKDQGDIHFFDRFIQGEEFNLRGFPYGEFGPTGEGGQFIGGDRYYFTSIELRFPYIYVFQLVLFSDWGNLFLYSWSRKKATLTPGVGLRIKTPVGPLRFDLAFVSGEKEIWKTANFSFGLGQYF